MRRDRRRLTIGRIMVGVAAVASVLAVAIGLAKEGALAWGSPLFMILAFGAVYIFGCLVVYLTLLGLFSLLGYLRRVAGVSSARPRSGRHTPGSRGRDPGHPDTGKRG